MLGGVVDRDLVASTCHGVASPAQATGLPKLKQMYHLTNSKMMMMLDDWRGSYDSFHESKLVVAMFHVWR